MPNLDTVRAGGDPGRNHTAAAAAPIARAIHAARSAHLSAANNPRARGFSLGLAGSVSSDSRDEVDVPAASASIARPRSCAEWKRSSGRFSRHRRTTRSSADGSGALPVDGSGGSSFRTSRHRLDRRRARECPPAGQHLKEDGAERKDVAARVHRLAPDLLGRHIAHRPEHRPWIGLRAAS